MNVRGHKTTMLLLSSSSLAERESYMTESGYKTMMHSGQRSCDTHKISILSGCYYFIFWIVAIVLFLFGLVRGEIVEEQ